MDLDKIKAEFISQRDNILAILDSEVEIDIDGDEADEASASAIEDLSKHLSKRNLKRLWTIERALKRIEDGVFGECEECGVDIGEKRLLAKPDANTCIDCAEKLERIAKQFA